jgi:hypothetical protein
MAYDSVRGSTVLFGGFDAGAFGDTWEWNGSTWAQLATAGPHARWSHAMAYDDQRGRMVLFGGANNGVLGDTWEWDGLTWIQPATTGPAARYEHAMAYDSQRGRIVLFGGGDGTGTLNGEHGDTWEWDGASWVQVAITGPLARQGHAMAYDSQRGRTVVFGGSTYNPYYVELGDTWEWDGAAWAQVSATGPAARHLPGMMYDSWHGRTALFGGYGSMVTPLGDLWEWDGGTWTQVTIPAPPARWCGAMAFDSQRGRTMMFAGTGGSGSLGDTWEWDRLSTSAITRVFGSGCGSPALTATPVARPLIGESQFTDVTNIPVSFAAMAIGFSNTSIGTLGLPLALDSWGMPGCYLYHNARIVLCGLCSPTGNGQSRHALPIPGNNALLGVIVYLQAWSATNQNAAGLLTSNAIELTLGNY